MSKLTQEVLEVTDTSAEEPFTDSKQMVKSTVQTVTGDRTPLRPPSNKVAEDTVEFEPGGHEDRLAEVSEPDRTEVAEPGRTGVSEPGKTGVSEPGRTGVTEPGMTGVSEPDRTGVTEPERTGVSEPGRPGVSEPGRTGMQPPLKRKAGDALSSEEESRKRIDVKVEFHLILVKIWRQGCFSPLWYITYITLVLYLYSVHCT